MITQKVVRVLDYTVVKEMHPEKINLFKITSFGTPLVVHWPGLSAPNVGGRDSIPGQGTRSCMPQLRPGVAK